MENETKNERWYATAFDLYVAEAVPRLKRLAAEVGRWDAELTDQLRRARSRVGMALAEADGRRGGNRRQRLREAAGEAHELIGGLRMALAQEYVEAKATQETIGFLGRVVAMTTSRLKRVG